MLSGTLSADEIRLSSVTALRNTANQMASEVFNMFYHFVFQHLVTEIFAYGCLFKLCILKGNVNPEMKIKMHYLLMLIFQTYL